MPKYSKDDNIWKIKFEGAKPLNEEDELEETSREINFELYVKGHCTSNGDIITISDKIEKEEL